jgi:uncharacterized protein (TIGR02598 family)
MKGISLQYHLHAGRLAYDPASRLSRSYETAQLNHQKDNASQSDIIPTLQGGLAIYILFFEFGCVNGTTPQVDSETERSRRATRCFLIRAPASILRWSRFVSPWAGRRRSAAFTLVEVVIAIGLVAFVTTAILGLAMMAANETKNADLKARLAWITESVTSECQSQRFSTVLANVPATKYWDYSGMPVANAADAYFLCDVSNVTPPPTSPNLTTNNFALLQLSIRWPNPQLTSSNVCLISLFDYQ